MSKRQSSNRFQHFIQTSRLWLFMLFLITGLTLIYSFNFVAANDLNVQVGQTLVDDVVAPKTVNFQSDVLTQAQVELATNSVSDVYTQLDTEIGRGQLNLARSIFTFIDVVRSDTQATNATKLLYLQAIEALKVEESAGAALLTMSSPDYEGVRAEVLRIVGEIMREEIRDTQVSEYRRQASREAQLDLTPTQTAVITNFAPQFIISTVFLNEAATEQQRLEAADSVEPQIRTIVEGQRVVQGRVPVSDADHEALVALGLLEQETDWRDVASVFIIVVLGTVLLVLYWEQYHRRRWLENGRYLFVMFGLMIVFALLSRLFLSGGNELVYWFPIAAFAIMVTVVFEERLAIMAVLVMSVLHGFAAPNSLELMLFSLVGGIMAILTLNDAQRLNSLFRAGLSAAVGHITIIVIFQLTQNSVDVLKIFQLILFALANGILSSALSLVGFYLMGSLIGITTTIQLQDLSRLDHELLQELLRRAPGTYHHSIMVANLAEQAGEEINANTSLIRVGAFYHDIGKMNRPPFFTENQEGINPHDTMDPYTSARIILSHVSDGLVLAHRYRLPDLICSFIEQHHGTRLVKGFYIKARELAEATEETVDASKFRYDGPIPQSPETAIVLMADAIESASRALQPDTPKAIEKLVNSLIDDDLAERQLDDSDLTLGDIRKIRESFIKTLKGRFHVRVKYPGNEELMIDKTDGDGETADALPTTNDDSSASSMEETKPLRPSPPS